MRTMPTDLNEVRTALLEAVFELDSAADEADILRQIVRELLDVPGFLSPHDIRRLAVVVSHARVRAATAEVSLKRVRIILGVLESPAPESAERAALG